MIQLREIIDAFLDALYFNYNFTGISPEDATYFSLHKEKLNQAHVNFEYSTTRRCKESMSVVSDFDLPLFVHGGPLGDIRRHATRTGSMLKQIDLCAELVWRNLPEAKLYNEPLSLPKNVFEADQLTKYGMTVRGLTDYFIGTDSLITRLDFRWI